MIEIKVQCPCGAKYKFDVEPVNGRVPAPIQCPICGVDGTDAANQIVAFKLQNDPSTQTAPIAVAPPPPPPPPPSSSGLRLSNPPPAVSAGPMHYEAVAKSLLQRTSFFIKERVGILKLTDTYDILDPASGQQIGIAKEEPHVLAKWLRLIIKKHMMPTTVNIYEFEGQPPVASIKRGVALFRTKVRVTAGTGESLGYFKSKLFSIGGGFEFDEANRQVAEVKGDWKGWNFKFLAQGGREIGTVTKKWAGLGRELFTSADNYIISLNDLGGASPAASALLLAAGLAIDMVYKEAE